MCLLKAAGSSGRSERDVARSGPDRDGVCADIDARAGAFARRAYGLPFPADALASGALPIGLREQIAIAVAAANDSMFASSAIFATGGAAGRVDDEIAKAQNVTSADPASAAALGFAWMLLDRRSHVSDTDMAAVRAAGFDDGAIAEIAAAVALNTFANLVNNLACDSPEHA